jgi:hypothetical protein
MKRLSMMLLLSLSVLIIGQSIQLVRAQNTGTSTAQPWRWEVGGGEALSRGTLKNVTIKNWGDGQLQLTEKQNQGEFISEVFDAGRKIQWGSIEWASHWTTPQRWRKYAANPVLPQGAPGQWDNNWTSLPSLVRVNNSEWRLYYCSSTNGIGFATGNMNDPAHWKRYEKNPVFTKGRPGKFDSHGVLGPEIVQLSPLHWYMYYATGGSGPWRTGLAESHDGGLNWTRVSEDPIIPLGLPNTFDGAGTGTVSVMRTEREWKMWYTAAARRDPPLYYIGYATSADGIHWSKHPANPVLSFDPFSPTENIIVSKPHVIFEDGIYKMWYSSQGLQSNLKDRPYSIGYAESADGIRWMKYPANPVLRPSPAPAWDSEQVEYPEVVRFGKELRMWFCGSGYTQIGYAVIEGGGSTVEIQTRSGDTASPDDSWSKWSNSYQHPTGSSVSSPPGRYLQFRALFRQGDSPVGPALSRVVFTASPEQ